MSTWAGAKLLGLVFKFVHLELLNGRHKSKKLRQDSFCPFLDTFLYKHQVTEKLDCKYF